jgi:hypothetical protein
MHLTPTLKQVQQQFSDYILKSDPTLIKSVKLQGRASSQMRCDIYREGYQSRLHEILEKDFPKLQLYLGESAFYDLAQAYIESHVSTHFSIGFYSDQFVNFMQKQSVAIQSLQDFARFDKAINICIESADANPVSFEDLVAAAPEDWPGLIFTLHPSACHFETNQDVVACWEALASREASEALEEKSDSHEAVRLESLEEPARLVIWCPDKVLSCYMQLTGTEKRVFEALSQGDSFETVCENLCEYFPQEQVAQIVIQHLQHFIAQKMFCL